MKPVYAKILEGLDNEIYATKIIERSFFSTEFHFHKECQFNYVVESEGRRIIGDNVQTFGTDELTFLGSDLPHVWHNDRTYFEKKSNEKHARSVALFFNPQKMLEMLVHFENMKKLEYVINVSRRGMIFFGSTKEKLIDLLLKMTGLDGLPRIIALLEVFEILCHTQEYELLASAGYTNTYQLKDNDRIDKVFKYVFDNFTDEIELEEVASLVCMNKQAFCRYFKSRTQKTFVGFVNEVRITHACKLMADEDYPIATLAYECGFNSLSNFNRFFKNIKGVTPRDYKKMLIQ